MGDSEEVWAALLPYYSTTRQAKVHSRPKRGASKLTATILIVR